MPTPARRHQPSKYPCGAMPTSRRTVDAEVFPPSRQGSTSAERVADGDAETMRKQGAKFAHSDTRGREDRCRRHLSRGKDFKTLVLKAFFPPFLSPKKERGTPEAQRRGCGLPHRCRRSSVRNDGLREIQANNSRRVFHILLTTAKKLL